MQDLAEINKLAKERRAASNQILKEYRFTPNEMEVLVCLSNNPEHDTATDICIQNGASRSLVCRSVESLVKKGYITLQLDPVDRRYIHLVLNESALPIVKKLAELQNIIENKLTSGIPEYQLNVFEQVLRMMLKNAAEL